VNKNNKPKQTWYFDTVEGIDSVYDKTRDFADHKWTPKENTDHEKARREAKLGMIKDEEKKLKKFSNEDITSYPSDPEQKRILTNIDSLEKNLKIMPDTWKRFVRTGAIPIGDPNYKNTWDMMKEIGSPKEKREYARMEREDELKTKKRENLQKFTEKREKINAFRKARAEKIKKSEPATKMAQEIVNAVEDQAKNIVAPVQLELFENQPIQYAPTRPVDKSFTGGLHEGFVKSKIKDAEDMARIEKEIYDEV